MLATVGMGFFMVSHAEALRKGKSAWLASYPRSGSTWARMWLWFGWRIKSRDRHGSDLHFQFKGRCPVVKTHKFDEEFPRDFKLYVVRDGRDVCVSLYHYFQKYWPSKATSLDAIIRGESYFGSWSEHVRSWRDSGAFLIPFLGKEVLKGWLGEDEDGSPPSFHELHSADPNFFRSGKPQYELSDRQLQLFDSLHGDTNMWVLDEVVHTGQSVS